MSASVRANHNPKRERKLHGWIMEYKHDSQASESTAKFARLRVVLVLLAQQCIEKRNSLTPSDLRPPMQFPRKRGASRCLAHASVCNWASCQA